jgi:hypothetical protein
MIDVPPGFDIGQFMTDLFTVGLLLLPIIGLIVSFESVLKVFKRVK